MGQSSWMALFCAFSLSLVASTLAVSEPEVTVTLTDPHFPDKSGYHVLKATAKAGDQTIPFACGVFLPPTYFKTTDKFPIVISLHTRGNSGADGGGGLVGEGLGLMIASGRPDTRGSGARPPNPVDLPVTSAFITLLPQCPAGHGWKDRPVPQILAAFVAQIARIGRGDEDRVYLTGFSYGGSSTWEIALQVPDCFAAIVPLDGRATPDPTHDVEKLSRMAIYESVGSDDPDFIPDAEKMRTALHSAKHDRFIYHIVQGGNHWCYGCVYTDPEFWKWLLAQRRHNQHATTPATTQPLR